MRAALTQTKKPAQRPSDLDFVLTRLVDAEAAAPHGTLIEGVEYRHQQFEDYFVTADPAEIHALDANAIPSWRRTGQRYRVFGEAGDPVCRLVCAGGAKIMRISIGFALV